MTAGIKPAELPSGAGMLSQDAASSAVPASDQPDNAAPTSANTAASPAATPAPTPVERD